MPTFTFASFNAELDKLQREISTAKNWAIAEPMAKRAQKIAAFSVNKDIGGDSFSRWLPNQPIPLDTHIKRLPSGGAVLHPSRVSAGPWTVAERGRYSTGGVGRFQGPGVNMMTGKTTFTKTGKISTRRRSGVRYSGSTAGFQTASDAVRQMERELPNVGGKAFRGVLRKHFDVSG